MESERDLPILISQKSEKDILLAILSKLTATEKTRLGEYFQKFLPDDARILTWTPPQAVLLPLTKQKSCRDSQANLYALGVLLHRLGLSTFLVADELTKRQLTGKCRLGENSAISAIMIAVRPAFTSAGIKTRGEICMVIKRTKAGDYSENLAQAWNKIYFDQDMTAQQILSSSSNYKKGGQMLLHDPHRPPFSVDTTADLERERYWDAITQALASHGNLPQELFVEITSQADRYGLDLLDDTWLSNLRQTEDRLFIHVMFPVSEEELEKMQTTLRNACCSRSPTSSGSDERGLFELVPFERYRLKTRDDLITFWKAWYRTGSGGIDDLYVYFLQGSTTAKNILTSTQFGVLRGDRGSGEDRPAIAFRTTFLSLLEWSKMRSYILSWHCIDRYGIKDIEIMYYPDNPFYSIPPPWRPFGEANQEMCWAPAFYLTNQLTEEQDSTIRKELTTNVDMDFIHLDGPKEACYVPWRGAMDGTQSDIWNIIREIEVTEGILGGRGCHCFFCIDAQSGVDQTVLLIEVDWLGRDYHQIPEHHNIYPGLTSHLASPNIRGFHFRRVPGRYAHVLINGINTGRQAILDVALPEWECYERPGWPASDDFRCQLTRR